MPDKVAAEKLLLKPGQQVRVINPPVDLVVLLGSLPQGIRILDDSADAESLVKVDVTIFFADGKTDLVTLLPGLRAAFSPQAILWVAYHKGTSRVKTDINRDSINAYANTLGLQGVSMISINEDWSALRLKVIQ